jgi:UDP-2,3-diacylglucosamine pyrophosphatase LpxH
VAETHDVFIVSDLHLCEGWLAEEHRYARLEVFFYDREFSRWVDRIIDEQATRGRPALLLLNGDVFDFLAVTRTPSDEEAARLGFTVSRTEKRFGLASSERKSAWKMERILRGHRIFFVALARFLAAGNRIVFLRGNHDVEIYWPMVQEQLVRGLARLAEEEKLPLVGAALTSRIQFRQWFYYEPGRFYIEHGNQYDESNSFRYGLCPELPARYTEDRELGLDYPLGSLFVRYLYNKLKTVDPFSAYFVSLEQYVRLVGSYNFLDMTRAIFLHVPIFFRAIKGLRLFEQSGTATSARLHLARRARTGRLEEMEVPVELLDRLVVAPAGKTKHAFLLELLRPVVRGMLTFLGVSLVALLAWFLLFQVIQQQTWLAEGTFGRASLMALLAVITFIGLFLAFSQLNRRLRSTADPMPESLALRAERIGEILDVPIVCMGHTHQSDYRRMREGRTVYANSGTWIRFPGPWDQIKQSARQFTFLRIQEGEVDLLRWDDPNGVWEPVPLLEGYHPSALERLLPESTPDAPEEHPRPRH